MSGERLDRRNFFRHGWRGIARAVADAVPASAPPAAPPTESPTARLRPPGALDEAAFLEACTRCEDCFTACPVDALVPVPDGQPDAGTPRLLPASQACAVCSSLACTQVCEAGALQPLRQPEQISIGLARLDPARCLSFQDQHCEACVSVCPTRPRAVALQDGHPSVHAADCTGCGLCEQFCPVEPRAIVVENPARQTAFQAWAAARLERTPPRGEAAAVAEVPSPPEPERRATRRIEPIIEPAEDARQPPSTIPRPLAAVLLIAAPILAILGVLGWARLLLTAPVVPAPAFDPLAVLLDLGLCLLFVIPHSIFARGYGRKWLNMPLGPCGERPLYVFVAGCTLLLLAARWQSSGPVLWDSDGVVELVLRGVQAAGLVLAAWAALVVGGAQMLGIPHLRALAGGHKEPSPELVALPPYSLIRQPLNLGVLIALVAMPELTLDRLLLMLVFGLWILFIAPFEERDAEMQFGEGYTVYRTRTPRWWPRRSPPTD